MGLSGPEMLMKSIGLDPIKLKESIEGFQKLANNVAETQQGIDRKLDTLADITAQTLSVLKSIDIKVDQILSAVSTVENPAVQFERDLPNLLLSAAAQNLPSMDGEIIEATQEPDSGHREHDAGASGNGGC